MSAESYMLAVIRGEKRDPAASLQRGVLAALSLAYVAGLKLFLLPYRLGIRSRYRLPCPVISVGNLTTGGTGKTPMTRHVCELLRDAGLRPCVLIRGYRGRSEHRIGVVSTPERIALSASEAGDEAYLLARLLPGVPVLAGKDRRATGALACERFRPDVIVLDDGMQFYQLHRDLDIVLLDATRPFDNGWALPRGLLREPSSHLRRAGIVAITNTDRSDPPELGALKDHVKKLAPRAYACTARHAAHSLSALDRSTELPVSWLSGRRVGSLSALGNPESFESQIERAGGLLVARTRLPDHQEPTMGELQETIMKACAADAEAIIVSEKDAVKLPPLARPIPFYALRIRMQTDDDAAFRATILGAISH